MESACDVVWRPVACDECKGACCESMALPLALKPWGEDNARWVRLHATKIEGDLLWFDVPCTQLTSEGRCAIYETRPEVCRRFVMGGPECLATVAERRRGGEPR